LLKWFIVGAIAVAIILVGSYGRIPFTEISLATSAETQATAVAENTPRKPRSEALFQVRKFLEEECSNGDMYLKNAHRFEAVWMRMPWTNDHHYREGHEWTVTDQLSGAFWRYYEDTGEIVSVKADC
tara:strand:+ start:611 stop:991 length:381 start_codon:yes stop_codon:yes gene_type:complete